MFRNTFLKFSNWYSFVNSLATYLQHRWVCQRIPRFCHLFCTLCPNQLTGRIWWRYSLEPTVKQFQHENCVLFQKNVQSFQFKRVYQKWYITSKYSMPLPSFNTPKIVSVNSKLPIVKTLISQTIIQKANVFRLDIFNVSSESDAFDFIFDFISTRISRMKKKNGASARVFHNKNKTSFYSITSKA